MSKRAYGAGRTARIGAMLTPQLLERLQARAAWERRTLSTMVELILERELDKDLREFGEAA
jgi:hypothetical protein